MAETWETLLYDASYDGAPFDMLSVRDEGGNDLDEQKYPDVDGARYEARNKKPETIQVTATFIDEDYPEAMNALLAKLRNGGAVKELVHPIYGKRRCAVDSFTVTHDAEDGVDCGMISIVFKEDNGKAAGPQAVKSTLPARANEVRSIGSTVLTALAAYQAVIDVIDSIVEAVQEAEALASTIADEFEAATETLSTIDVQARANVGLATCDAAIALLADYTTTEQYELSQALQQQAGALRDLAQDLIEARPPLSEYPCPADTNLLALAHALEADAEELLALNSFPDPAEIPAGWRVMFYAV